MDFAAPGLLAHVLSSARRSATDGTGSNAIKRPWKLSAPLIVVGWCTFGPIHKIRRERFGVSCCAMGDVFLVGQARQMRHGRVGDVGADEVEIGKFFQRLHVHQSGVSDTSGAEKERRIVLAVKLGSRDMAEIVQSDALHDSYRCPEIGVFQFDLNK
jgi:hypothetical protein